MAVASLSVGVVEEALKAGNSKTALAVLRGLGFLDGAPPAAASDDPDDVATRRRHQKNSRELDALLADIGA